MKIFKELINCNIDIDKQINMANISNEKSLLLFDMDSLTISLDKKNTDKLLNMNIPTIKKRNTENFNTDNFSENVFKKYNFIYEKRIKEGKDFINSLFKLHNIFLLRNGYQLIEDSPFNLIVHKKNISESGGFVNMHITCDIDNKIATPTFTDIQLPFICTRYITLVYMHEIMHTQVINEKSSGKTKYLNNEILPIFIEYLYLLERGNSSLISRHNFYRLNDLKDNVQTIKDYKDNNKDIDLNLLEAEQYFISNLVAYKLFYQYYKSSIKEKKEILSLIQAIFDNNSTIEEMLDSRKLDWSKTYIKKRN